MRRLDDLDNRGRRNNLQIRQIQLKYIANTITFILQRPEESTILFDSAHRALKPKGISKETPRDVICRVHYFTLKKEIQCKARTSSIRKESTYRSSLTSPRPCCKEEEHSDPSLWPCKRKALHTDEDIYSP
ncbi:Hypothetical predicted protein [Pelobates cultripes]|uniref:Uncharacterized protein n=1 Tax=Pelobates cultripes TaxID=61616 RepID=A0AAD1RKB0_PELCU|nr:Hypothetical predicted protein [Pelobates cultripes]